MTEKRDKTHTEIQDFMDNKLGVVLSDLRRELKLTEARLRDNHQVCGFLNLLHEVLTNHFKSETENHTSIIV